jgi:hypothetical protein
VPSVSHFLPSSASHCLPTLLRHRVVATIEVTVLIAVLGSLLDLARTATIVMAVVSALAIQPTDPLTDPKGLTMTPRITITTQTG